MTAGLTASRGDDDGFAQSVSMGCRTTRGRLARVVSPAQVAEVEVIACELSARHDPPLRRFSRAELHRPVVERDVTEASASTIRRWIYDDAIKPRQTRSWIFPRDPAFAEKAARALDLYARSFEGRRLRTDEDVICADEKTQLRALGHRHSTVAPGPGRPGLVAGSNPAELFFSIVQRKALTPNDLATLPEPAARLTNFAQHYRSIARPFEWTSPATTSTAS